MNVCGVAYALQYAEKVSHKALQNGSQL